MTVGPIQTYVMDHESEADMFLADFFKNPKNKSMDTVRQRAQTINFASDHFRDYFLKKAAELLGSK